MFSGRIFPLYVMSKPYMNCLTTFGGSTGLAVKASPGAPIEPYKV